MKTLHIILIIMFYSITTSSQAPDTSWTKIFASGNGWCKSAKQTLDGGYILAGNYCPTIEDNIWWPIKTDSLGNIEWSFYWGGSNAYCNSVVVTSENNFVFVGVEYTGSVKVCLVCTNALGELLWEKEYEYGGSGSLSIGNCVENTSDGGFIIAGKHCVWGEEFSVLLIKTDATGNVLWMRSYGEVGIDDTFKVKQTNDGVYVVVGYNDNGIYHPSWLLRTDSVGDTIWTKLFNMNARSLFCVEEAGYIIAGSRDWNMVLVKTDNSGNKIWERTFGGDSTNILSANSVILNESEEIVIAGSRAFFVNNFLYLDAYLLKTNLQGEIIWEKNIDLGFDEGGMQVRETNDGGYVITGNDYTFCRPGIYGDLWLVKLAPESPNIVEKHISEMNYLLEQNYPNPFNPSTTIKYSIPTLEFVTLKVYNLLGEEVSTLLNENKQAGIYSVEFNTASLSSRQGSALTSGMYIYRLMAGNFVETKKMILLK